MSKYTTEVRFICETASGLNESKGYTDVDTIIINAIPKIFNFDFPIFDESYRTVLEKKILKHFYTREIGEETVGLWKLRLDTRLNEIMPYYNQLYKSELLEFNPLYTVNLNRTRKTNFDSERNENESVNDSTSSSRTTGSNGTINSVSNSSGTGSGTNSNTNTDLYSDTPQGSLIGVESETYLTNARKVTDSGQSSSQSSNQSNGTVTSSDSGTDNAIGSLNRTRGNKDTLESMEDYLESVNGYDGKDASELLMKYRESFLNIDVMVINNLEDLFFQLW